MYTSVPWRVKRRMSLFLHLSNQFQGVLPTHTSSTGCAYSFFQKTLLSTRGWRALTRLSCLNSKKSSPSSFYFCLFLIFCSTSTIAHPSNLNSWGKRWWMILSLPCNFVLRQWISIFLRKFLQQIFAQTWLMLHHTYHDTDLVTATPSLLMIRTFWELSKTGTEKGLCRTPQHFQDTPKYTILY